MPPEELGRVLVPGVVEAAQHTGEHTAAARALASTLDCADNLPFVALELGHFFRREDASLALIPGHLVDVAHHDVRVRCHKFTINILILNHLSLNFIF